MKEKIKFLLESIGKNVQIRQESDLFDRCEFYFDADYFSFGIVDQIYALSDDLSIGVIGFNQGKYYITVYGLSAKS